MGALHAGHLSLLDIARGRADVCVMSIFVNPSQFGPKEDFGRYPRPFEKDCDLAQKAGCDILFAPQAGDMYPDCYRTYVSVTQIEDTLCGAARPGHFKGVATVVLKFLNIVQPHCAVFGQKDAQQFIILRRMVRDLNMGVEMVAGPIVREADGLAMSSRNAYLTSEERREAVFIYQGLCAARKLYDGGERKSETLRSAVHPAYGQAKLLRPEYVEIVDTVLLAPLTTITAKALVVTACRTATSNTRLIDNVVLGGDL
jgi:pantoate--beta-alanine ligase